MYTSLAVLATSYVVLAHCGKKMLCDIYFFIYCFTLFDWN